MRIDELVALARHARTVLAGPRSSRLLVHGLGGQGWTDVDLLEHGGQPTFPCPEGTTLRAAATTGRVATLTLGAVDGTRVVMAGRLALCARDAATLGLTGLFVQRREPGIDDPVQIAVPLEHYRYADGPDVGQGAALAR